MLYDLSIDIIISGNDGKSQTILRRKQKLKVYFQKKDGNGNENT